MRMALTFFLVIFGLVCLPNATLPGLLLIGAGGWVHKKMTAAHEERFMGGLMILGGLGALALVIQFIIERF